ncbi:hypothetical protein QBC39DRAFT_328391 [Podospora conica]|nr:hypothetical protein QBC39DRAFT_328391 [Schizothecium conicum]
MSSPSAASSSQPPEPPSLLLAPPGLVDSGNSGASSPPPSHASRGGKLGGRGSHSAHRQRTASPSASSDVNSRITPRSDRPGRSATLNGSFPLEPPSGQLDGLPRKRGRTSLWSELEGPSDEGHSKGGHSLRKRARVDYTQELIDIDYPTAGRPVPDQGARSMATPTGRGRKQLSKPLQTGPRSGDDAASDGLSSAATQPRRRRPTQSPAPARGSGSSRRRPPSRKSTTAEPSPFRVDQPPPDNELVQDTILVGVPMDGINSDDSEGSESFDDNRSATQDSELGQALAEEAVEPTTPQPSTILQVEQAVSVASESEVAIGNDLGGVEKNEINDTPPKDRANGQPDPPTTAIAEAASVAASPVHISSHKNSAAAAKGNQQPVLNINDTKNPSVIFHTGVETASVANTKSPPSADSPPTHSPPHENQIVQHQIIENQFTENQLAETPPVKSPPQNPNTPELAKARVSPEDRMTSFTTPKITRGWGRLRRAPRNTEPARLKQLDKVYQAATPFATALGLSPYVEDDEVLLPGPFSEVIQREDISKAEATPMPTPAPTPPPAEAGHGHITWDGRTRLTVSQFYDLWKFVQRRCEELGEQQPTWQQFHNSCVRRLKASQEEKTEKSAASVSKAARMGPKASAKQLPALVATASFEDTPQGSQAADSEAPTAAPSPAAAIEEDPDVDAEGEDDVYTEEVDSLPKTTMTEPIEVTRNPTKQYRFPKLRDPQEFVDALKDPDSLTKDQSYDRTAAAVEVMATYENEYHELKKMLDDEENAKRRVAHDKTHANWENRQKADEPTPFRRHYDEPVKGVPTFEVRGARAPAPYIDDAVLEHQKQEDKIQAQSSGFKYNSHAALVGRQNPEEQRWEMPENRLRERRKTEKGAELAEEGGDGKRVRRMPRNLSDQSKDPSRAGTPIASGPGLRGKRKLPGSFNEDDEAASTETATALKPSGRGRGGGRGRGRGRGSRGGRGGRGASASAHQRDNFRTPSAESDSERTPSAERDLEQTDADAEFVEKPTPSRKRPTRGAAMQRSPPKFLPESPGPKAVDQHATKPVAGTEMPTLSFGSNYASVDNQVDSRPSTASSAIAETVESTEAAYSLREKRKRNFALENDPVLEPRANKRARAAAAPKRESSEPKKTSEPKKKSPRRKGAANQPAAEPVQAPIPPSQPIPFGSHAPALAPLPAGGLQAPPMFFNAHPPGPVQAPHAPYMNTFSSVPHQSVFPSQAAPPAIAPAAKKPITKIRLTNNGSNSQASSRAVTPAAIAPNPSKIAIKASRPSKAGAGDRASVAPGAVPGEEKAYTEMSKSEKMSFSMKRRWANGEMQGAVEKRRNTLAHKKAEKAANSTNGSGNDANPRSASASASGTPTPVPLPATFGMPPQSHNPPALAQQVPLQYPHGGLIPAPAMPYFPPGDGPAG